MYGTPSSSRQKMTFWTFPDVCRPSNLITSFSRCFGSAVERIFTCLLAVTDHVRWRPSRFWCCNRARFDGGASQHRIFEVLGEHPIVSAEVARIVEISGNAHNIGERRPIFRENSTNR